MSDLSLMAILGTDPEFGRRISKKVEEIKQDKKNLLTVADEYSKKYEREIEDGEKLRRTLLTEGETKGLSEDEVMQNFGKFLPSRRTPLLNLLYFLLCESNDDPVFGKVRYQERDIEDKELGELFENIIHNSKNIKETPEISEFLYGEASLEQFNTIKKLKALSKSPNEAEAFQAYRKAMELCNKCGLDFDKIPCYVGKRK